MAKFNTTVVAAGVVAVALPLAIVIAQNCTQDPCNKCDHSETTDCCIDKCFFMGQTCVDLNPVDHHKCKFTFNPQDKCDTTKEVCCTVRITTGGMCNGTDCVGGQIPITTEFVEDGCHCGHF